MAELATVLLIVACWLGHKGYLALCEYIVEKIVILLHGALVTYGLVRLFV